MTNPVLTMWRLRSPETRRLIEGRQLTGLPESLTSMNDVTSQGLGVELLLFAPSESK